MCTNPRQRKRFREFIRSCLFQRLERAGEEFSRRKRYLSLSAREDELFNQLINALPEEMKRTLIEYSDTLAAIMVDQQEFFYKQGFIDGHMFINDTLKR